MATVTEYNFPGHSISVEAGGALTGGTMVALNDDFEVTTAGDESATVIGYVQKDAIEGDKVNVLTRGVLYVTASGAITQGARLVCAASGAVKVSANDGSDEVSLVGRAMEDASDTNVFRALISI